MLWNCALSSNCWTCTVDAVSEEVFFDCGHRLYLNMSSILKIILCILIPSLPDVLLRYRATSLVFKTTLE
jgi:hypothetical protein